ncbi:MAG: FlgD immunoglobulin-like domain containing protein [Candidatus Latescibacterota bacterium]
MSNLILSSRVLTPNGDGIGDRLEIEFDLLKVMTPRPVEAVVYDLAGRRVQTLELAGATAGHHVLSWNGRDDRDVPVPPGSYLLRVRVEGDAGTQVFDRLLAVAY